MKKAFLTTLLCCLGVLFVLAGPCLFSYLRFGTWDPMLRAFLTTFELRNEAGVPVTVTPIGMLQGSGKYGPLPRYESPSRARPAQCFEIPMTSGQTLRITYDWDDINFRHLLVRVGDGHLMIVDTDRLGTRDYCYCAQKEVYVVPQVALMQPAPMDLEACTRGESVQYSAAKEYPQLPNHTSDGIRQPVDGSPKPSR